MPGPARGRIGEHDVASPGHGNIRPCHADIDRRLAGHYRHVRGVGDQQRALHHAAPGIRVLQLRKTLEHVDQFVAAFTATDVDHDVGIDQRATCCCTIVLPAPNGRARPLPPLSRREEGIEDTLPGDQGSTPWSRRNKAVPGALANA